MTKTTADISTVVLKNADPKITAKALSALVRSEVERRPHLREGVQEIIENKEGLHFRVSDDGVMQHLANTLTLDKPVEQVIRLIGKAYGRTGKVGILPVTVWYIEH